MVTILWCCIITEASSFENGDSTKIKKIIPDSTLLCKRINSYPDSTLDYKCRMPMRTVNLNPSFCGLCYKRFYFPTPIYDQKNNSYVFTRQALLNMQQRNINSIVGVIAGIDSRNGETPNIKGARAEGTAYFIDGVRTYQLEPYYLIK